MKGSGLAAGTLCLLPPYLSWPQQQQRGCSKAWCTDWGWRRWKKTTPKLSALLHHISPGVRLQRRHSSALLSWDTGSLTDRQRIWQALKEREQKRHTQPALWAGAAASPPQHARWTGKSGAPLLLSTSFSTSSSVPLAPLNLAWLSLLAGHALPHCHGRADPK